MHQRFRIANTELLLLPERAIYWPEQKALLVADLHLGKSGHFQKHGIPISGEVHFRDLDVLGTLLQAHSVERLIFLGDLFHSAYNREWEIFADFMAEFDCQKELIVGNHDRLVAEHYQSAGLQVYRESLRLGNFELRHEPLADTEFIHDAYVLCGHIHPGVRLQGAGKQRLRLPCFHFMERQGILPAFGQFTGLAICYPEAQDHVFVIAEGEVIEIA
ncbi:MAG: ligase-associated DNA damage response endonuclease PdeM [Bacteroidota bacterium]